MRKFIAAIVVAVVLALTGCTPDSGDVYAKDFIPEHIEYRTVQDYIWVCKPNFDQQNNPGCSMTRQWSGSHEEPYIVPDCYYIAYENEDGDKGDDCVGKTRWDIIDIGDYYEKA